MAVHTIFIISITKMYFTSQLPCLHTSKYQIVTKKCLHQCQALKLMEMQSPVFFLTMTYLVIDHDCHVNIVIRL